MENQNEIFALLELAERHLAKSAEAVEAAKADLKATQNTLDSLLRDARRRDEKSRVNLARAKAKRIAAEYDIVIEDASDRDRDGHYLRHWVHRPDWLKGDDPITDGHYSHDWSDTLWLVEFYSKHHPSHPEHANREYGVFSPHC